MTKSSIFITGGAQRIGKEIALYFAKKKWRVGIQYRDSFQSAQELHTSHGISIFKSCFDQEKNYLGLVDCIYELMGPIDVFVHSASHFFKDSIENCTRGSWDRHFEVNLRAPFVLSQHYVAKKSPSQKQIIFLLDQRVLSPTAHFTSYTLSKAALLTLTKTMAMALGPDVRVNAIAPGPVFPDNYLPLEKFQQQCQKTILQRPVDAIDIAKTVDFLISIPSITGQVIALDSGQHLGSI
jgi:NAD(P)-dependent dehydrogenase (short-subunit alcohol dehydrogenase family)